LLGKSQAAFSMEKVEKLEELVVRGSGVDLSELQRL